MAHQQPQRTRQAFDFTHLGDVRNQNRKPSQNDGLLVDDVELLRDGRRNETTSEDGGAGLGDEVRGGGELVDDLRRTLGGGLLV